MSRNPFIDEAEFLRGYVECAIWSSNDPDTEVPLDDNYDAGDLDSDWEDIAREDCAVFARNWGAKLAKLGRLTGRDDAALGHDFWLTRNGHGAGYWDRYMEAEPEDREEAKQLGEEISEGTKVYGEKYLMPIGDGRIGE